MIGAVNGVTICDEWAARHAAERWNLRRRVGNEAPLRVATGRNGRDGARFGYGAGSALALPAYPRVTSDDAHCGLTRPQGSPSPRPGWRAVRKRRTTCVELEA